jgi:Zn-dependent M28 family amino/carboxypeptidase
MTVNKKIKQDGSGSTCVFESFKVIAKSSYNPSKTLGWLFYSAEESGLVGSTQIAAGKNKK